MSRIGKLPIIIKEGVEVSLEGKSLKIKGPKGELSFDVHSLISINIEDGDIKVNIVDQTREARALFGMTRTIINNMMIGVTDGFEKKLSIHGVGYRAAVQEKTLVLNVGFSHPVEILIPDDIEVRVEKNVVIIIGLDKVRVGQFAADIRAIKKPEPYKGKGIRYENERIRRKAGKAAKAAG